MPSLRRLQTSWVGGEIGVDLHGRVDIGEHQAGAAKIRNMLVRPGGSVFRRPGTRFVREVKNSAQRVRLLPFVWGPNQAVVIEMGAGYFRFHADAGTILVSPAPANYKIGVWSLSGPVPGTDRIVFAAPHGFTTGDPVRLVTLGTMPLPLPAFGGRLRAGVTYYASVFSATAIYLTQYPGGPLMGFQAAGVGDLRVCRFYQIGDLVNWLGPSPGVYYCTQDTPAANNVEIPPPLTTHWYAQPAGGILEVPNPYVGDEILVVDYAQSADYMALAHPNHPLIELIRRGPGNWAARPVVFGPNIEPPFDVEIIANRGATIRCANFTSYNPVSMNLVAPHQFEAGDAVFWDGGTWTGNSLPVGVYIIDAVLGSQAVRLRTVNQGLPAIVTGGVHTNDTGSLAFTTSSADSSQQYVVTSINGDETESLASASKSVDNNLFVSGASNRLFWSPVGGAVRYYIYKRQGGVYGYVGSCANNAVPLEFIDDGIAPDLGTTPPITEPFFNTLKPGSVAYHEQRRVLAGYASYPQLVLMTRTSTDRDLTFHIPSLPTDRVFLRYASNEVSIAQHFVTMRELLMLTDSTEYRISAANGDGITPSTVAVRPQSYVGSSKVKPVVVNNTVVFAAERGGHLFELGYRDEVGGYATGDLCLRIPQLTEGNRFLQISFHKTPTPVIWGVQAPNGRLLGLTYVPQESVSSWHTHDTDGLFESVVAIPGGNEDQVWVSVNRTIGGLTKRFIEVFQPQDWTVREAGWYVDCGLRYVGAPVGTLTGLGHLEGKTVSIVVNGRPHPSKVVTGGAVTLEFQAIGLLVAVVGLPYTSELQTLPLSAQVEAAAQGRTKNVTRAFLRVRESGPFEVGPSLDNMVPANQETQNTGLRTGEVDVRPQPAWDKDGQLWVRQAQPLPLDVSSLTLEVAIGS